MALALALSVLGRRAKHAHVEASLTHLCVFRFKDIITEYSELQHRCPNHICVQPETKPLISQALAAVGTAGDHGSAGQPFLSVLLSGATSQSPGQGCITVPSGAPLTFKGRGQRGGLGAGGQAADGQVAFGASVVVQHTGVHG